MSITIEIRPTLEQRLREKARDRGVNIDDIIEQVLESWSENALEQVPETETSLLEKINRTGFSEDFWSEYHSLIKQRQEERIDESGLRRLIEMSDMLEFANVQRLENVVELAKLRQVSVPELLRQLDIPTQGNE
ncbi:MAG: hypothetical protein IAE84_00355 [Saprospiraceae bacterium]|jgi:hypothetical protein|nr:hypothetical protein [Saprospiraceae bacterium]HRD81747.1 hypothetical protein [Saprospiraceae bacterium]